MRYDSTRGTVDTDAPFIDEIGWWQTLRDARPDLVAQAGGSVDDAGWQALVLRPRYRDELIGSKTTPAAIRDRESTEADRAAEVAWAEGLRRAQRGFVPTATVRPAGYPLEVYTGYRVGGGPLEDADGLTYKVFFELDEFTTSLSSDRYVAFVEALAAAGFAGDSKIDLRPGAVRFDYNDVIVHAGSASMALCAEQVGLAQLGAALAHVGRGVDLDDGVGPPVDWHHLLLLGAVGGLPEGARRFVTNEVASAPDSCPSRAP
jgi:hypothetical protein